MTLYIQIMIKNLENIVIQVKSKGGKGLARQLISFSNYNNKIDINYAPKVKPSMAK